jgi:endonuclease YncB( thermonuclease family)
MKTFELAHYNKIFLHWISGLLFLMIIVACSTDLQESPSRNQPPPQACEDCELVEVIGVVDGDTLITSVGEVHLYGGYVLEQPADCAALAKEQLRNAAGSAIRIEPGPIDSIRNDDDHFYIYASNGTSIGQQLVEEGLALIWTQDGQHLGRFVYLDAVAKKLEAGCLWHDYQAFQRGEPNEFRIPGLTYRD